MIKAAKIMVLAIVALGAGCVPDKPAPAESASPKLMSSYAAYEGLWDKAAEKRRAAEVEVLARPGQFVPPVFSALANELAKQGRDEEAAKWWLTGYLRIDTEIRADDDSAQSLRWFADGYVHDVLPQLRAVLMKASVNHKQWVAETIALDEQIGRDYPTYWPTGRDSDQIPDFTFQKVAPPDERLLEARKVAAAALDSWVVEWRKARDAEDMLSAVAARGGVLDEAAPIIPEPWRARVKPIRSIDLKCAPAEPDRVLATPGGAKKAAFLVDCRGEMLWLDERTGVELSRATFGEGGRGSHALMLGTDGEARYPLLTETLRDVQLLAADGRSSQVQLPIWWNTDRGAAGRLDVSRSGRWLEMRAQSPTGQILAVIDARTFAIVWSREFSTERQSGNLFGAFREVAGREIAAFTEGKNGKNELVLLDVLDKSERRVAVPLNMVIYPRGEDEKEIAVAGVEGAMSFDIETLTATWRGRSVLELPPSRADAGCTVTYSNGQDGKAVEHRIALIDGQNFEFIQPKRAQITACAVSSDRSRMLVVVPPFAHLYEIKR